MTSENVTKYVWVKDPFDVQYRPMGITVKEYELFS